MEKNKLVLFAVVSESIDNVSSIDLSVVAFTGMEAEHNQVTKSKVYQA